jgi:hypothetical protein
MQVWFDRILPFESLSKMSVVDTTHRLLTRSHLQVLQPFLVGFGAILFAGCEAMDVEKFGHAKVFVDNYTERTTMKEGGGNGPLFPRDDWLARRLPNQHSSCQSFEH